MNQEEIKMTKNFIKVQLEQVEQFKKFSDKIFHNMEDLLKDPTFEKNSDFSKRSKDFIDVISYLFLILEGQTIIELENSMAESRWASIKAILEEQQLEEEKLGENLKNAAKAVLLTEGGNKARETSERKQMAASGASFQKVADDVINSVKYVSKKGTPKGTSSAPRNDTDPKQLIDQRVSTLRRIFYHQSLTAEVAEKTIDLYLKKINVQNYNKSSRRPNWVYAPLK
jgi:L-rhamnose mutarotase